MQSLKELVSIVRRYSLNHLDIYANLGNSDTKFDALFNSIKDGQVQSEEDAIELLYPDDDNGRKNFLKLKNRFKKRIINTLFFLDLTLPSFNDYNRAYYEGTKHLSAAIILNRRGAAKSAKELAEKGLKPSLEYEYADLVVGFSRILKSYYILRSKNDKKYKYYRELEQEYLEIQQAEKIAEDAFYELIINFVNTRAPHTEQHHKAKELLGLLEPYVERIDTYSFLFYYNTIWQLKYETVFDYRAVEAICEKTLSTFKSKPFLDLVKVVNTANSLLGCQVKLGKYTAAQKTVEKYLKLIGNNERFLVTFQLNNCMLKAHTQDYLEAFRIYYSVIQSDALKATRKEIRDNWKIIGAYLYFLDNIGKIPTDSGQKIHFPKFRLGRFLNETFELSKDKRGYNIVSLILQILIFLKRREFSKIYDRVDALTRYSSRYLRRNDTFRSNCFINMIAAIPQGYFNRIATQRHAQKYIKKLESMPLETAPQPIELEFIPYEKLWEYTLDLLDE